jgi:hypothetical protein
MPVTEMMDQLKNFSEQHQAMKPTDPRDKNMPKWTLEQTEVTAVLKGVAGCDRDKEDYDLPAADNRGWRYNSKTILFYVLHLDGSGLSLAFHTGKIMNARTHVIT